MHRLTLRSSLVLFAMLIVVILIFGYFRVMSVGNMAPPRASAESSSVTAAKDIDEEANETAMSKNSDSIGSIGSDAKGESVGSISQKINKTEYSEMSRERPRTGESAPLGADTVTGGNGGRGGEDGRGTNINSGVGNSTGLAENKPALQAPASTPPVFGSDNSSSAASPIGSGYPSTQGAKSPELSENEKKDIFQDVEAALNKLTEANIVFNTPKKMKLDEISEIQLVLGVAIPVQTLKAIISVPGETDSAKIKISQDVSARLSGAGFSITEVTESRQPVTRNEVTEWKWQIVPQREGVQRLHLSISAEINASGASMRKVVRTFDKDIDVNVSSGEVVVKFFSTNWQWLFAAILVPVFGWGMKKINGKRIRRTDD